MKTPPLSGVIFDLDETLLTADINFNAIREKIGCEKGADILAHLETITDPQARDDAQAFIRQEELKDAYNAQWIPGAKAFVEKLHAQKIPVAIVTRNSEEAAQIKLTKNQVPIDTVVTREHAPAKPDPSALLQIAREWAISPQEIAYVGDFLYDVLAANNANMHACLFLRREKEEYAQLADFIFEDYSELESYILG
ncbi:HAD family hydrolase [Alteromonas sp. a30]|uniref:HAD family hydrolase n=1 Tax=Alteromonas sp. a30 TaxID=2730917 RepID=UPI00227EEC24|nr:HAD-IIIA family hydrolase [Alteromonas sp. a30]MCY7294769.1 HAD family hydrolase [Alteromonas sp. a30]